MTAAFVGRGVLSCVCSLLLILVGRVASQNEGIYLGTIEMQMGSTSGTTSQELLFSILSQTTTFLDQVLKEKFKTSNSTAFIDVTLSVDSFHLEESQAEDGGTKYDAGCKLQGIAMFERGASPQSDEAVRKVVRQFLEEKDTLFLQSLRSSVNPFLQDILFVVVTTGEGDPNFGKPSSSNGTDSAETSSGFVATPWMIALMAMACLGVLMILSCLVWYCHKSCQNARHDVVSKKPSLRTTSRSSSESSEEGNPEQYRKRSPSVVSPLHSITSQDSSKFTFNPQPMPGRGRGERSNAPLRMSNNYLEDLEDERVEESTSSNHSMSFFGVSFHTNNNQVDVDVDEWRKGSTVTNTTNGSTALPFGQDISAIEMISKRDLSLIEEGENEEMTPHSSVSGGSNRFKKQQPSSMPNPVRLSLQSLVELEREQRRRRQLAPGAPPVRQIQRSQALLQPASKLPKKQKQQPEIGPTALNLNRSAAAVIDELNDLSAQIDDYRRR
jgi:hypothetical protein